MKSVFLIAIVAVAMIGMIVPSVFANHLKYDEYGNLDLSQQNLSGADLSGDNLYGADLSGANLSGADLSDAILSGADLSNADLSGANLSGADLSEGCVGYSKYDCVPGADLSHANLRGADLTGAVISGAILSHADLTGAMLYKVDFSGIDISNTKFRDTSTYDEAKQKEKERLYAAQLEKEAASVEAAQKAIKQSAIQAAYQAKAKAISNLSIANGEVDKAAEKIASLDEKLDKSNTRAEINTAYEMMKEAKEEYNTAVEAAEKATKEMAKAIAMYDKAKTGTKDNTGLRVALPPLVGKYSDTVPEWTPERNSDDHQTLEKVSPEEAKQRMDEIFDGNNLPMAESSEELKDPIPTEKEMFDNRMLAEATTPKPESVKPWWCFWC